MKNFNTGTLFLDRYLILKVLGSGGNGTVYLAEDKQLNRKVAIKVLHEWSAQSSDNAIKRFEREAQSLSDLLHANITRIYRYGEFNGSFPFIVMEFVDGESLKDFIARKATITVSEVVAIAIQIAQALEYAHKSGIVHRDLKPENIVISQQNGQLEEEGPLIVKLLDFGLSKSTSLMQSSTLTKTGMIVGTVFYMSPEQGLGEAVDARSDIYSLGCLIYELVTGSPPFVADLASAVLLKHMSEPVPSLSLLSPQSCLPSLLDEIIARCCQKNKDNRYRDCSELLEDLRLLGELKSSASFKPVSALKTRRAWKHAQKVVPCSLLFLIVIAGTLTVISFTDKGKSILAVQSAKFLDANSSIACFLNQHAQFLRDGKLAQARDLAAASIAADSKVMSWTPAKRARLLFGFVQNYSQFQLPRDCFTGSLTFFSNVLPDFRRSESEVHFRPIEEEYELITELSRKIYHEPHSKKDWQELSSVIELNSDVFPRVNPETYLLWPAALRVRAKVGSGKVILEDDRKGLSRMYVQAAEVAAKADERRLLFEILSGGIKYSKKQEFFFDEHCQYATLCEYYLKSRDIKRARLALLEVERITKDLLLSNADTDRVNRLRISCGVGNVVSLPSPEPDEIEFLEGLFSERKRRKVH